MSLDASEDSTSETKYVSRLLNEIARRSVLADLGETDLSIDMAAIINSGMLSRLTDTCLPGGDTDEAVTLLRALGRVNLAVGRLAEGHVNAAILIHLYGSDQQQKAVLTQNHLHGVWGADGGRPVEICQRDGGQVRLLGRKKFCSGLGLVRRAVMTARTGEAPPQMVLIDTTDQSRAALGQWQVSGMRATCSGGYDVTDQYAEPLGQPGDFLREPHFEGGIWRYLALHAGGLEALAEETRQHLGPRAEQPLQAARLVDLATAAHTARLWVEAAAKAAGKPGAGSEVVALVLLARHAVENACQQGIALAERALGTAAFVRGERVDLIRRDLAFFLRQADLDGKTLRAAKALASSGMALGAAW